MLQILATGRHRGRREAAERHCNGKRPRTRARSRLRGGRGQPLVELFLDLRHVLGLGVERQSAAPLEARLGTAAQLDVNPQPRISADTAFTSTWNGTGAMKVGRGLAGGSPTRSWLGTVDNVQVMDGPASEAKLRTTCAQVEL